MDIFGRALTDYYYQQESENLWINNEYGEPEEMPVEVFFRNDKNFPMLETIALDLCYGQVLDVGAGSGSHALWLQQAGIEVTALEISALASEVMKHRGVKKTICQNIFHYFPKHNFDTILLLMNGIGLAGNLTNLKRLLTHFKLLLKPGGQILFDSSDIAYLYEDTSYPKTNYYGELNYQYVYKKQAGDWFQWLYIDPSRLASIAFLCGWEMNVIYTDEMDQYLVKLTLI